jgi:hypothetical protein
MFTQWQIFFLDFVRNEKKTKNLYFLRELQPRNVGLLVVETSHRNKPALNKFVNWVMLTLELKVLSFKIIIASVANVVMSDNETHYNYWVIQDHVSVTGLLYGLEIFFHWNRCNVRLRS